MAEQKSKEDLDRELIELLNEIRVTLPGVQVLFAFLLVAPFSQRFGDINDLQKYAYLAALTFTALGSALLIAPTPYHRIRFRDEDKDALLRVANVLAIAGTLCSRSRCAAPCSSSPTFCSRHPFRRC